MASRRAILSASSLDPVPSNPNDPLRELFEACKTGDIVRVKKLISGQTVNARDTAGRKSTPLHFAAGPSHEQEPSLTYGPYGPPCLPCFIRTIQSPPMLASLLSTCILHSFIYSFNNYIGFYLSVFF